MSRSLPVAARWAVALALTVCAGAGLSRFRVENRPDSWSRTAPPHGAPTSYVLVGAPFSEAQLASLTQALRAQADVAFVIDRPMVEQTRMATGVAPEGFVSGGNGYSGVFVFPSEDMDDATFVATVRGALTQSGVESASLVGPAVFHTTLNAESQRGLPLVMGLITVVGGVVLWTATGRLAVAAASMVALLTAQGALLGLASWFGQPMSMTLSLVPPLMMTIGFSFAAHWSMRRSAGAPLLLCLLTTGAGIGVFALSSLAPVRSFGVWGVIGLCMTFLWVALLVPPNSARRDRPHVARRPTLPPVFWRGLLGVGLGGGLFALPRLAMESNALALFGSDSTIVVDYVRVEENLTGGLPFFVETTEGFDVTSMVKSVKGVRTALPLRWVLPSAGDALWCLADNDSLQTLSAMIPEWERRAESAGATLRVSGVAADLLAMTRNVASLALWSLPSMALLAAVSAGLVSRRLDVAIGAAFVNLWPVAMLAVGLWALGRPLTVVDAFIGAIAIGVGADDTIHIAHSLRRTRSVEQAMARVWRPCLLSSVVAAACLAMFAFSPFGPTARFGVLLGSALLLAVIADLLMLPHLLARSRRAST